MTRSPVWRNLFSGQHFEEDSRWQSRSGATTEPEDKVVSGALLEVIIMTRLGDRGVKCPSIDLIEEPADSSWMGSYTEGGRWKYMIHPKFALAPGHYVRGFLLLLKDLQELFDYIEPADKNLPCYSYRVHALLLRACVEVEANCKAILKENGFSKPGDMNMGDYKKIDKTHLLSLYQVKVPNWSGSQGLRTPFLAWSSGGSLPWYQAYNTTKHDRHTEFEEANFGHLIDACCGLLVHLSAQFGTNDFSQGNTLLAVGGPDDGMESGIGGYFRVKFPDNWPLALRYDFDWQAIKNDPDPFQAIDYTRIA